MTLRTEPSDRDVRNRLAASRVDLGTRYVTVCVVSFVVGRSGGSAIRWGAWSAGCGGRGVGKQWTEKESFQQYFCNRYKILHTCHTYCCYAYRFYSYWLYFIYVWHVYVSPKTYKWFGTFSIKDGRYTFTFYLQARSKIIIVIIIIIIIHANIKLPSEYIIVMYLEFFLFDKFYCNELIFSRFSYTLLGAESFLRSQPVLG
jgi:hypothetical protein